MTLPTHTCPDCNADLDAVEVGQPCPTCGGMRRDARVYATAAVGFSDFAAGTDEISIRVTYGLVPGWQALWAQIERRIASLARMYEPSGTDNAVMGDELDALLTACNHMADWLEWDNLNPPVIDHDTIDVYVRGNHHLSLCRDYANSYKHHTLSPTKKNPDPRHARLHEYETGKTGQHVLIAYWTTTNPKPVMIDGLFFARECRDAWLKFFKQQGIVVG